MEAREGAACQCLKLTVECMQAYDPTIGMSYFPSGASGMWTSMGSSGGSTWEAGVLGSLCS